MSFYSHSLKRRGKARTRRRTCLLLREKAWIENGPLPPPPSSFFRIGVFDWRVRLVKSMAFSPLPFSIFSTQENFLMCQFCICCQLPFKMSEKKGELFKVQIRSVEVKRVCHANGPKRTWCMHSRKKGCQKRDLVFHIFVSFDQIALLKMPFFGCKRPYDYRVQTPQPPKS